MAIRMPWRGYDLDEGQEWDDNWSDTDEFGDENHARKSYLSQNLRIALIAFAVALDLLDLTGAGAVFVTDALALIINVVLIWKGASQLRLVAGQLIELIPVGDAFIPGFTIGMVLTVLLDSSTVSRRIASYTPTNLRNKVIATGKRKTLGAAAKRGMKTDPNRELGKSVFGKEIRNNRTFARDVITQKRRAQQIARMAQEHLPGRLRTIPDRWLASEFPEPAVPAAEDNPYLGAYESFVREVFPDLKDIVGKEVDAAESRVTSAAGQLAPPTSPPTVAARATAAVGRRAAERISKAFGSESRADKPRRASKVSSESSEEPEDDGLRASLPNISDIFKREVLPEIGDIVSDYVAKRTGARDPAMQPPPPLPGTPPPSPPAR